MELNICGKMKEIEKITGEQAINLLHTERNLLFFGLSGRGKSQRVKQFAKAVKKKLLTISLAMEMPETTGGIPYATKEGYFKRLMDERLIPVLECEGEGWIIFFDEINQAPQEVMNCLYGICEINPEDRNWNGHPLRKVQIVAAGNLDDGSDGTTYLTPLPTPLTNRFFIAELQPSKAETKKYLKEKYKNIPQVVKYIDVLLDNDIPPRDIEECLKVIAYEKDGLLLQLKLGGALTAKLYDIQKKIKTADPAKTLKLCRQSYEIFKEDGIVQWAGEEIETEEDLLDKFREILSEEEIKSIVKGE